MSDDLHRCLRWLLLIVSTAEGSSDGMLLGIIHYLVEALYKQKMHISNNTFKLARLTRDMAVQCSKLLTKQFMENNQVWAIVRPSKEEASKFILNKTLELLDWEQELREEGFLSQSQFINFAYLNQRQEIVSVVTCCDLTQYLNKKSKHILPQYQVFEKYGKTMMKSIYAKDIVPGKNIYGGFAAIKSQYEGTGVLMLFWFDLSHYLHQLGFRFIYTRASSPKIMANMVRYGGDQLDYVEGVENGKPVKFWWLRWSCRPLSITGHLVDQFKLRAKL